MSRLLAVATVLVVLAALLPGRAAADSGVQELWKEYPLKQQGTPDARGRPAPSQAAGRARAARDDGGSPLLPVVGAAVLLCILASGAVLAARRRDTGPPPRPTPVHHEPGEAMTWATGETVMGEPGHFDGPVEYDGAEMVLVRDERRGAVWVWRSEIARSDVVQRPRVRT